MSESIEFLRDYRSKMDVATEALAMKLVELGVSDKPKDDDELVDVATRKIGTLFEMLKASGLNEGILRAVMAE